MTESGDNVTIFANVVVSQYPEQAYRPSHTHTTQVDNVRQQLPALNKTSSGLLP